MSDKTKFDLDDVFADDEKEIIGKRKPLSFDDLIPTDHETFVDNKGEAHDYKDVREMSAVDYGKVQKLMKLQEKALELIQKDPENGEYAKRLERHALAMIGVILPTLDLETIDELPLGAKMQIVNYWNDANRSTESPNGASAQQAA